MPSDPSKTEKPTPKRLKKARDEGNVAKSEELSKLGVLIFGLIMVRMYIGFMGDELKACTSWFLTHGITTQATVPAINTLVLDTGARIASMTLPLMLVLALGSYLIVRLQVGHLWTTKVFTPKFDKVLNLVQGLKRLVSMDSWVRMARSMGSAIAVGIGPYIVLKNEINNLLTLFYSSGEGVAVYILQVSFKMVLYSLVPLAIIAAADTFYSFWKHQDGLKMSKDEVKDERKQAEGDPKVKSKQKQKMMEVMQKRMLQNVPKADVIVTNPTHFAVAIMYNGEIAPAPLVVAKGADHMARKIRELAEEAGVPIRENKPLARALYDQVEVGDVIPEELYKAVATILAKLPKFKKKRAS